jgi:hypothetical protein
MAILPFVDDPVKLDLREIRHRKRGAPCGVQNLRGEFFIEGQPAPPRGEAPVLSINHVSPGYFDTLGMRLIEGRDFTTTDKTNTSGIVIINETMARRFWLRESAVGKRLGHLDPKISWREIIGVVSDLRFAANLLSEPEIQYQMSAVGQAPSKRHSPCRPINK